MTTTAVEKEKVVDGKVGKVILAKTSKKDLRNAVREIAGKDPTGMSVEEMVRVVQTEFATYPKEQLIPCDDCGGESDVELSACPFCGAADAEAGTPVPMITADKEAQVEKQTVAASKPPKKNGVAKEKNGVNPGLREEVSHKAEVVPDDKLSLLAGGGAIVKTEKDLDAVVAKIHSLQGIAAGSVYDIGKCVYEEAFANKLWTQRLNAKGQPAYKSFKDFVKTEIQMSHTFIYQAMEVAQYFTRDVCLQVGGTHLRLLVGAPKEDREELLAIVKEKGLTKIETKNLVQEVRRNKGVKQQNNRGTNATPASPGRTAQSIAVTLPTGKVKCKIHQRGQDEKRVRKSLGELKPVIRVEGLNGVVLTLQIIENAKGEWEAHGAAKREE